MDVVKKDSELADTLERIKDDILTDVNRQLTTAIGHLLSVVDGNKKTIGPKLDRSRSATLPDREFVLRNSSLTDLWSVSHVSSVFNICTAFFLLSITMSTLFYISDPKSLVDDLELLFWAAGKIYAWLSIWLAMKFSCILVLYPAYAFWATTRKCTPKITFYDGLFLTFIITYLAAFLIFPVKFMFLTELPPVSSLIVLMEQARMIMKSYAFVRENFFKTLKYKPHQDGDSSQSRAYPEFQKFLYFLFVPTLVYRDSYPRTLKIRWEYVLWYFLQIVATMAAAFIAFQRFVIPIFQNVGHHYFTPTNFVITLSGSILVGTLAMFCGWYGLLHCWMNAFAEMLRYGDRMFYEEWWNCTTFSQFYRRWNRVVYDWIYEYPYRDMQKLFGHNQTMAQITVLFYSAVLHEAIIALTLRFLLPVMFVMYAFPGIIVQFATKNKTSAAWNVFVWISIFFGWGFMIFCYSIEWYARKNCPLVVNSLTDYVFPRAYTCNILKFTN